ncbi:hypothetical protein BDZ91DRAFT_766117 [Kalaharituber pfeilii]|nr:hypothetical protein BDZ91DRAFT_766117 [Kalaharituber pfeilii]
MITKDADAANKRLKQLPSPPTLGVCSALSDRQDKALRSRGMQEEGNKRCMQPDRYEFFDQSHGEAQRAPYHPWQAHGLPLPQQPMDWSGNTQPNLFPGCAARSSCPIGGSKDLGAGPIVGRGQCVSYGEYLREKMDTDACQDFQPIDTFSMGTTLPPVIPRTLFPEGRLQDAEVPAPRLPLDVAGRPYRKASIQDLIHPSPPPLPQQPPCSTLGACSKPHRRGSAPSVPSRAASGTPPPEATANGRSESSYAFGPVLTPSDYSPTFQVLTPHDYSTNQHPFKVVTVENYASTPTSESYTAVTAPRNTTTFYEYNPITRTAMPLGWQSSSAYVQVPNPTPSPSILMPPPPRPGPKPDRKLSVYGLKCSIIASVLTPRLLKEPFPARKSSCNLNHQTSQSENRANTIFVEQSTSGKSASIEQSNTKHACKTLAKTAAWHSLTAGPIPARKEGGGIIPKRSSEPNLGATIHNPTENLYENCRGNKRHSSTDLRLQQKLQQVSVTDKLPAKVTKKGDNGKQKASEERSAPIPSQSAASESCGTCQPPASALASKVEKAPNPKPFRNPFVLIDCAKALQRFCKSSFTVADGPLMANRMRLYFEELASLASEMLRIESRFTKESMEEWISANHRNEEYIYLSKLTGYINNLLDEENYFFQEYIALRRLRKTFRAYVDNGRLAAWLGKMELELEVISLEQASENPGVRERQRKRELMHLLGGFRFQNEAAEFFAGPGLA